MYYSRFSFFVFLLAFWPMVINAQYSSKEAFKQFENGNYELAIEIFNKDPKIKENKNALAARGKAYYHSNRLNSCINDLSLAKKLGNKDDELIWYVAKAYHHKGKYEKAISFYKSFLETQKKRSKLKPIVLNDIKRCAFALGQLGKDPQGTVESFGKEVNSNKHEISPIASVNTANKFYFSSNLAKDFDVFSVVFENGGYVRKDDFDKTVNSSLHDIIQDLSPNGEVLFIERGKVINGDFMYNQFSSNGSAVSMDESFEDTDVDFYFVDNNTVVFSSIREGGYGGYDLYIRKYINNKWSAPRNLGPTVNSIFDERSPFITPDGSTLFFSCNGLQSFGGYDVFKSTMANDWKTPTNLGVPINSPGDDLFFKVTQYGQLALLSSDRKTAVGGFDIYKAFLQIPIFSDRVTEEELAFVKKRKKTTKEKLDPEPKDEDVLASANVPKKEAETQTNGSTAVQKPKNKETIDIVETTTRTSVKESNANNPISQKEEVIQTPEPKEEIVIAKNTADDEKPVVEAEKKKVRMASGPIRRKPVNKSRYREKPSDTQKAASKKEIVEQQAAQKEEKIPASEPINKQQKKSEKDNLAHQVSDITDTQKPSKKEKTKKSKKKAVVLSEEQKIISPLFYEDADNMLVGENEMYLQNIIDIMTAYPEAKVILTGHSHNKGLVEFQLFRTLLNAEKIASYLGMFEIDRERIIVKSVGSNYPYVKDNAESSVQKFNQKIDVRFDGLPIDVEYMLPDIRSFEKDNKFEIYHTVVDDLYYRVEIASQGKIYKNSILRSHKDLMVEKNHSNEMMNYTIGLYPSFEDAVKLKQDLENTNVPYAEIVPYVNGVKIEKNTAASLTSDYPDLENFLKYQD